MKRHPTPSKHRWGWALRPLAAASLAATLPAALAADGPATRPADGPARRPTKPTFLEEIDRELDRALADPDPERRQDPLRFIAGDMGGLVEHLARYETDQPVQAKQDEVVRSLDEVIRELEKQCSGGAAGGGAGGKPLGKSGIVGGPGGQGAMIDPRQNGKTWAALPPKQREQILQSQTEGFPPGYESILQSYYRRLSQEQTGADAAGRPSGAATATPPLPTTQPGAR